MSHSRPTVKRQGADFSPEVLPAAGAAGVSTISPQTLASKVLVP